MSDKYCDALIIGTDLAGLITGAFLAKRGLAVTVFNSPTISNNDESRIESNLMTHLDTKIFKNILGRLAISDQELGLKKKSDISYQVVTKERRIDISGDRRNLQKELQREFPKDADKIIDFYKELDYFDTLVDSNKMQELILPKTIKEKWNFSRLIKQGELNERLSSHLQNFSDNHELTALIEAQINFLAQTVSHDPFTYIISKLLANQNCHVYELNGGIDRIKRVFMHKIESYGGQIKTPTSIEEINFEKRKVHKVQLGGFEGAYRCRYLIWNQRLHGLLDYLPENLWTRSLRNKIHALQPKYYSYSIQYRIKKDELPAKMAKNLLFINDSKTQLIGSNYFHINVYEGPETSQDDCHLNISYLLEADSTKATEEYHRVIHDEITEHLKWLLPFCQSLKLTFPIKSYQKEDNNQDHLLFALDKSDFEILRDQASENPIYESQANHFSDLFTISNRCFYKNLFLASPEVLSAFGFEGKFILGLKTLDLIWDQLAKQKKQAVTQRKIA